MNETGEKYGMDYFDGDVQPGGSLDQNNENLVPPEDLVARTETPQELEQVIAQLGVMAETDSVRRSIAARMRDFKGSVL